MVLTRISSLCFVSLCFIFLEVLSAPAPEVSYIVYEDGSNNPNIKIDTSFFMSFADEAEIPEVEKGPGHVLPQINYRPIIGIVSQELSRGMRRSFSERNFTSYIAASYVKFVEGAGARVVPILINQPDEYYENLTKSLNGFLFPGGSAPLMTSGYSKAAKKIYDLVTEGAGGGASPMAPLWGTCLGFENLVYFSAGQNPLTRCNASNTADPLIFTEGYEDSQLFGNVSKDVLQSLATQNITANFHKWCVLPETVNELGLNLTLSVLSTTVDTGGIEYVSAIEHRHLPIFGTQWHPEKAAFEWADDERHDAIPHTIEAIRASQALAESFVEKARLNQNRFANRTEETSKLIYNYSPTYVALEYNSSFQLCYFFH